MRVAAALPVALLAASVLAAEERRTFRFEFGGDAPEVRGRVAEQLSRWQEDALREVTPGSAWNERDCGPFDVVRRNVLLQCVALKHDEACNDVDAEQLSVDVVFSDPGVPSASAATEAIAQRVAEWYRDRVQAVAAAARREVREPAEADVAKAEASARLAQADLTAFEAKAGDPSLDLDAASERLRRVAAELADTKIDRAVTARKLDAARDAAARAVAVRALEERVKDAEADVELAKQKPATYGDALKALKETRALLADAAAKCPTLDDARARVASLEVDLVALETRDDLLSREAADLRKRLADLRASVRMHEALVRAVDTSVRSAEKARERLAEIDAKFTRPAWRLVWPVVRDRR